MSEPLSTEEQLVCQTCGGAIVPMRTSGTGYRHVPGLPECSHKPPLPAFTLDELIAEWVGHPVARRAIRDELERRGAIERRARDMISGSCASSVYGLVTHILGERP